MVEIQTALKENFAAQLDSFEKEIKDTVLLSGVAAMAVVIYDEARARVPVRTGLLQSAIYRTYSKERSTDDLKTYRISWNKKKAPHGHLIEFGTSRMKAEPFMRPAFAKVNEAIEAGRNRMRESMNQLKVNQ